MKYIAILHFALMDKTVGTTEAAFLQALPPIICGSKVILLKYV